MRMLRKGRGRKEGSCNKDQALLISSRREEVRRAQNTFMEGFGHKDVRCLDMEALLGGVPLPSWVTLHLKGGNLVGNWDGHRARDMGISRGREDVERLWVNDPFSDPDDCAVFTAVSVAKEDDAEWMSKPLLLGSKPRSKGGVDADVPCAKLTGFAIFTPNAAGVFPFPSHSPPPLSRLLRILPSSLLPRLPSSSSSIPSFLPQAHVWRRARSSMAVPLQQLLTHFWDRQTRKMERT